MATESTKSGHTNPDLITGAPASHPGATGIGSASGAATGAALGALGGPIGAVIGGVAGAIVGGGIGHGVGEAYDPSDMAYWKDEYKNRSYYDKSANYDRDVAPAYGYGSSLGTSAGSSASAPTATPRTSTGSTFSTVEEKARQGWDKARGTSSLDYHQVRSHIQDAYDRKVQGGGRTMAGQDATTGTRVNPDAITGAPGSHPGATGIGSASGAATGAALGAMGGPVGAVIGGVAGAAVGGGVGHAAGEAHDPSVGNPDDALVPNAAKRTTATSTDRT